VPGTEQPPTKQDITNRKKSSTTCNGESKPKAKTKLQNSTDNLNKICIKGHAISRTQNCDSKRFFCTFKMPNGNTCDVGFTLMKALVLHIEEQHEGEKQKIPCKICPKTFSRKSNFTAHMKNYH